MILYLGASLCRWLFFCGCLGLSEWDAESKVRRHRPGISQRRIARRLWSDELDNTFWDGMRCKDSAMVMVSEALDWLQCFRHRADDAEGICTADMTPTGDVRYRLGVLAGESLAMPVSEYLPFCEMSSS